MDNTGVYWIAWAVNFSCISAVGLNGPPKQQIPPGFCDNTLFASGSPPQAHTLHMHDTTPPIPPPILYKRGGAVFSLGDEVLLPMNATGEPVPSQEV